MPSSSSSSPSSPAGQAGQTFRSWTALRDHLRNVLAAAAGSGDLRAASHRVGETEIRYQSLTELRELLAWVEDLAQRESPGRRTRLRVVGAGD